MKMKIFGLLLLSLCTLSLNAVADEWDHDYGGGQFEQDGPQFEHGGGYQDQYGPRQQVIQRLVSQQIFGGELLKLRQILGLGQEDRGLDIKRVTIMGTARFAQRPLELSLLINGMRVSAPRYLARGSVSFVIPDRADDIGSDIRTLQVFVQGQGYIHAVSAVVEREREFNGYEDAGPTIHNF